jgi:hypothetical protein
VHFKKNSVSLETSKALSTALITEAHDSHYTARNQDGSEEADE